MQNQDQTQLALLGQQSLLTQQQQQQQQLQLNNNQTQQQQYHQDLKHEILLHEFS